MNRIVPWALLLVVTFGQPLHAQVCWRIRPLPECRSFVVTELGLHSKFRGGREDFFDMVTGNVGWMTNVSSRAAVGGTVQYSNDLPEERLAIMPRLRLWLREPTSLDMSAGLIVAGENLVSTGVTAQVGLDIKGWVGVNAALESFVWEELGTRERRTDAYFGAKLSSYAAVITVGVSALLFWLLSKAGPMA